MKFVSYHHFSILSISKPLRATIQQSLFLFIWFLFFRFHIKYCQTLYLSLSGIFCLAKQSTVPIMQSDTHTHTHTHTQRISSFFQVEQHSIVFVYHSFFKSIHPLMDVVCLFGFHTLSTVNNAAMQMNAKLFVWDNNFISSGYTTRTGTSGLYL